MDLKLIHMKILFQLWRISRTVKTNIPSDLRDYRYCIHCGIDTRMHPIINSNDVNHCSTLGDGLLNKKIVLSFGQKRESGKSYETYSNYQD
jgi:hypothetical protein